MDTNQSQPGSQPGYCPPGMDRFLDTQSFTQQGGNFQTAYPDGANFSFVDAAAPEEEPQDIANFVKEKVVVITAEHAIEGYVHISDEVHESRRLNELLNDTGRRFLALTDVELTHRFKPSTARKLEFLEVNLSRIQMVHPFLQSLGAVYYNPKENESVQQEQKKMVPQEVAIQTDSMEIVGKVYVRREAADSNGLSLLLNDTGKRFLALTSVRLVGRSDTSVPRHYPFLFLCVDDINLINPTNMDQLQKYSPEQGAKLDEFRTKLNRTSDTGY